MKRLEGKNVVITGCNRGIGKAILEKLSQEGANIIACTRSQDSSILALYAEYEKKYNIRIYPISIDLSSEKSVSDAIREILKLKIPIHILVNNAGIACFEGVLRLSSTKLKDVFQVNYFAPLMIVKGLVMPMMKAKGASVINMASVAGMDGSPGNCSYGASKAALILATKSLSKELSKAMIRVNAIAPSIVTTEMSSIIDEAVIQQQLSLTSLSRPSNPSEIANVVVFLASDESSYITGQTIRVDGGM